jgi:hypothetical protein
MLSAFKLQIDEEVPNAPLIGTDGKLTPKLISIFEEWYVLYSDPKEGVITKETCGMFIKGCTGEYPGVNDDRVPNLFA